MRRLAGIAAILGGPDGSPGWPARCRPAARSRPVAEPAPRQRRQPGGTVASRSRAGERRDRPVARLGLPVERRSVLPRVRGRQRAAEQRVATRNRSWSPSVSRTDRGVDYVTGGRASPARPDVVHPLVNGHGHGRSRSSPVGPVSDGRREVLLRPACRIDCDVRSGRRSLDAAGTVLESHEPLADPVTGAPDAGEPGRRSSREPPVRESSRRSTARSGRQQERDHGRRREVDAWAQGEPLSVPAAMPWTVAPRNTRNVR